MKTSRLTLSVAMLAVFCAAGTVAEKEAEAARLQPYSAEAFAAAKDEKRILFFSAKWCSACRGADKYFENHPVPEGTAVFRVEYDAAGDLEAKYNVTSQHTFVQVDENGKELRKWVGGEKELAKRIV